MLKRISSVTSMVLGVSAVISLIVYLYGAQVFASKQDINCLRNDYVSKELLTAKLETMDVKINAIALAVGARIPREK